MSEGFIPGDTVGLVAALPPEDCPYCVGYPDALCALHRDRTEVVSWPETVELVALEAEATAHLIEQLEAERFGREEVC